jgi:hypothetical protein
MREASPVKFYFAKYFFLAFGLLQWLCAMLLVLESDLDKSKAAALLFFTLGLLMITFFIVVSPRLKRVAIGKNRIAVMSGGQTTVYEWPEVKWIRAVPFVNMYRLKLRGKKERVYFLPSQGQEPVFGIGAAQPTDMEAMRKRSK